MIASWRTCILEFPLLEVAFAHFDRLTQAWLKKENSALMIRHLPAIFLLLWISSTGVSHAFTGKVVSVADGDTITVLTKDKSQVKIRLYGIDCPEKAQAFGTKAKQFTANLVFGKQVDVEAIDQDRYGRTVGVVSVQGANVNEMLLKTGYAWVYTRYCRKSFCSTWQDTQEAAQAGSLGLWSDPNPTPPWEYRRGSKAGTKKQQTQVKSSGAYHGNTSSHVFHRQGCRYFNCKNCTVNFQTREAAINAGYRPCGICKP
ncbi:thermonuclease family protein [Pseudodesulfovibrio portus]|uniref:thermonuclease family protein n=1 Tax=Pseudodesulfovibrio portus TaxID=231439 RepID=UPI00222E7DC0|nr:thermonuclease family protein [Pseudodesulfovibrio portus]